MSQEKDASGPTSRVYPENMLDGLASSTQSLASRRHLGRPSSGAVEDCGGGLGESGLRTDALRCSSEQAYTATGMNHGLLGDPRSSPRNEAGA